MLVLGLLPYEMEETEFLQIFAVQVVRMDKLEDFFFPNGVDPFDFAVFFKAEGFRKLAIVNVAGVCMHVAQYGNGLFGTGVAPGNAFEVVQFVGTHWHAVGRWLE